jgi:NADH-quinone oxidoreductase subunit L
MLSAAGGFIGIPHYLETQLPLPELQAAYADVKMPLLVVSVVIALSGLALAAFMYSGNMSRAASLRTGLAPIHRLLTDKYYIDELYERTIVRPLHWISERVFLQLGDRTLFDGTLHGLASMAQRTASGFSRIQAGSLHLYALLVLVGIVGALLWSWRNA